MGSPFIMLKWIRFHPLCRLIYHKVSFLCTFFDTTVVVLRIVTRTILKQPLSRSVHSGTKSWPVVSAVACFVLPSFETQGVYTHTNVAWSCSLRTEVCNCLYCRVVCVLKLRSWTVATSHVRECECKLMSLSGCKVMGYGCGNIVTWSTDDQISLWLCYPEGLTTMAANNG